MVWRVVYLTRSLPPLLVIPPHIPSQLPNSISLSSDQSSSSFTPLQSLMWFFLLLLLVVVLYRLFILLPLFPSSSLSSSSSWHPPPPLLHYPLLFLLLCSNIPPPPLYPFLSIIFLFLCILFTLLLYSPLHSNPPPFPFLLQISLFIIYFTFGVTPSLHINSPFPLLCFIISPLLSSPRFAKLDEVNVRRWRKSWK